MSPIITIQRQFRELGRIRMGEKGDKGQPVKLNVFRLTSPSQELIDAAAEVYGGEVRVWADAPGGGQFDLLTSTDMLDVIVPPGNVFSQWFELWSAAGCQRRCDGQTEVLTDEPCKCPADPDERKQQAAKGRACKPTTRLSLILPRIPDIGIWRLETHGFYAAAELPGTVDICRLATERGAMLPAQLRLHNRERKIPGQQTRRYVVPVLELPNVTTAQLTAGSAARPAVSGLAPAGALPPGSGVHDSADESLAPGSLGNSGEGRGRASATTPTQTKERREDPEPLARGTQDGAPQATVSGDSAGEKGQPRQGGSGDSGGATARGTSAGAGTAADVEEVGA